MEDKNTTVKKRERPNLGKIRLNDLRGSRVFQYWRTPIKAVGKREPSSRFCAMDRHKG